MNKAIQHRGPDDEGFWLSDGNRESFSDKILPKNKEIFPVLDSILQNALGFADFRF